MADAAPESLTEVADKAEQRAGFAVKLEGFEGPLDLLLALIARRQLEVTDLALHLVTDDFVAYVRGQGPQWDLDEVSSFLVVAATLLDLKAARLLPDGSVEDEEDIARLEARDLLFARLLQYRAFKEVSALLAEAMFSAQRRHPREVGLERWQAALLPEVVLGLTPEQFAALAEAAFAPKPGPPQVSVEHVHAPAVSVREQAAIVLTRLRRAVGQAATFRSLVGDADSTLVVIGRFLALLELYREGTLEFTQTAPLDDLLIRLVAGPAGPADSEIDEYAGSAAVAGRPARQE